MNDHKRKEPLALLLQLFAGVKAETIIDEYDKPVFTTLEDIDGESDEDMGAEDSDIEESQDAEAEDPLFISRLTATDKNLPHTAFGQVVVADDDGNLFSVSVDAEGNAEETALLVGEQNIEDGAISGSKLAEGTITSREIDMVELMSDTALMGQLMAQNIDAEDLFTNTGFTEKLTEHTDARVEELAVLKTGGVMTGPLLLSGNPTEQMQAANMGYVDEQDAYLQEQFDVVQEAADGKVSKAGDTMTGFLTLSGNPVNAQHAANKQYVDASIQAAVQNAWAGLY